MTQAPGTDHDDQDSEPTMTAPGDARPDGTVAGSSDTSDDGDESANEPRDDGTGTDAVPEPPD